MNCKKKYINEAAAIGDLIELKKRLETPADINAVDEDGRAPLHEACAEGHIEIVKYLIEKGAVLNLRCDNVATGSRSVPCNYGTVPLQEAAYKGHADIVELLLKNGAEARITEREGWTLLHYIIRKIYLNKPGKNFKIAKLLISYGADVNAKAGSNMWTPLQEAMCLKKEKIRNKLVELLIKHGAC
jgi:ankyrin repeat protein